MARKRSGIEVTASDALEFEPVVSVAERPRRRGLKIVFALITLGAIGTAGWVVYGDRLLAQFSNDGVEVPLLRAKEGPVKVRPESPGGLQVPNRSMLVYDRLSGDEGKAPPVERLLPPPEMPLPVPKQIAQLPAADQPKTARVPTLNDVKAVIPPVPAPPSPAPIARRSREPISLTKRTEPLALKESVPAAPLPTAAITSPTAPPLKAIPIPKVAQTPALKPARPVASATPTQSAKTPATPSAANRAPVATRKAYRVQLAASRTPEGVRAEWDRVRRKNLDLLGDFGLTVTRVDLGQKKGVFFRLRVGPLASDAKARQLCRDLKKRRIGCLVVKPDV